MGAFTKFLTDATTGAITNASGDYTTPLAFQAVVPVGKMWRVSKLAVTIEDGTGMTTNTYGGIATLSTGATVRVLNVDGTVRETLATGIKSNTGWKNVAGDGETVTLTNDLFTCVWEFAKPIDLSAAESFQVLLSDNMTGIITQNFAIQGVEFPNVGTGFSRAWFDAITIPDPVTSGVEATYTTNIKALSGTISRVDININGTITEMTATTAPEYEAAVTTTGAGTFPVQILVTFADGTVQAGAGATLTVVAVPMSATFVRVSPDTTERNAPTLFTADITADGDSVITSVTFAWGDGEADTVDSAAPYAQSHTYTTAGQKTITTTTLFSDLTTQENTQIVDVTL